MATLKEVRDGLLVRQEPAAESIRAVLEKSFDTLEADPAQQDETLGESHDKARAADTVKSIKWGPIPGDYKITLRTPHEMIRHRHYTRKP